MDSWHDYLALPVAPILLAVQIGAMFAGSAVARWTVIVACPVAIGAMFFYVASMPASASEGANIGAGLLFVWLLCSILVFVVALTAEGRRRMR